MGLQEGNAEDGETGLKNLPVKQEGEWVLEVSGAPDTQGEAAAQMAEPSWVELSSGVWGKAGGLGGEVAIISFSWG